MVEPRATRLLLPQLPHVTTELWMGGASAALGDPLHPSDLAGAWVLDCAGDMPPDYRAHADLWLDCVFADAEEVPPIYSRLTALARSLACCLARVGARDDGWEHPREPPPRLYVLCAAGLNRSGLVMGRILRELGLSGEEALDVIGRHRPGALNNLTFACLVRA